MRILFVISGLAAGGAERQVVLLSRQLQRQGHEALIYALNHETTRQPELQGSRVEVVFDQKRVRVDPCVLRRLRAKISQWKPDLVHGFLYDGNMYSRIASFGTGLPVLGSERSDNYVLSSTQRLGYRLTSWMCTAVVANSRAGAVFACRTQHISADRCHVVWNGIDLAEVDARLKAASSVCDEIWPGSGLRKLCMVGAIKEAKDYPLALRTMRALIDKSSDWRMVCVGDELSDARVEEKSKAIEECIRLGLEPFVKFVGRRSDIFEIMQSADALLVTSNREGFPNVVLEAMACRTPVVSTEYSDIRRILPLSWQVVGERDPEQLSNGVLRCFAEREQVIRAQRDWVEANATMTASMNAMLEVYRRYRPSSAAVRANVA